MAFVFMNWAVSRYLCARYSIGNGVVAGYLVSISRSAGIISRLHATPRSSLRDCRSMGVNCGAFIRERRSV